MERPAVGCAGPMRRVLCLFIPGRASVFDDYDWLNAATGTNSRVPRTRSWLERCRWLHRPCRGDRRRRRVNAEPRAPIRDDGLVSERTAPRTPPRPARQDVALPHAADLYVMHHEPDQQAWWDRSQRSHCQHQRITSSSPQMSTHNLFLSPSPFTPLSLSRYTVANLGEDRV